MGHRFHRGFTAAAENGVMGSLEAARVAEAIGRAFASRHRRSIFWCSAWWDSSAERRRSRLALTLAEREVISQRRYGTSIGTIDSPKLLGRSPSTVSREMSAMAAVIVPSGLARERLGASSSSKCCKLAKQSAATASCGGDAQIGIGRPSR